MVQRAYNDKHNGFSLRGLHVFRNFQLIRYIWTNFLKWKSERCSQVEKAGIQSNDMRGWEKWKEMEGESALFVVSNQYRWPILMENFVPHQHRSITPVESKMSCALPLSMIVIYQATKSQSMSQFLKNSVVWCEQLCIQFHSNKTKNNCKPKAFCQKKK